MVSIDSDGFRIPNLKWKVSTSSFWRNFKILIPNFIRIKKMLGTGAGNRGWISAPPFGEKEKHCISAIPLYFWNTEFSELFWSVWDTKPNSALPQIQSMNYSTFFKIIFSVFLQNWSASHLITVQCLFFCFREWNFTSSSTNIDHNPSITMTN